MAERIEYRGDALPSGLPGIGGSSTSALDLSGLSGFIRPLVFGAMVDAPQVTTPSPTPPVGSNPSVPTTTVVTPAPAPPSTYVTNTTNTTQQSFFNNITNINSICPDCRSESDVGSYPMLMGGSSRLTTGNCYDCDGKLSNRTRYFSQPAAEGSGTGVYYGFNGQLYGSSFGKTQWFLSGEYMTLKDVTITPSSIKLGTNTFSPRQLQVCDNGTLTAITILSTS